LVARFFFRGIYFPQMTKRAWMKLLFQNRKAILSLTREGVSKYRAAKKRDKTIVAKVNAVNSET
uniref:hypothetical protein n=1 Tax=Clavibacter michiganensis TaxID=28447 RepID=UPI002931812D